MAFILQVEAPLQGNFRSTSLPGCPGCSSGMLTCCLPTANLLQDSKWGAAQCSKQHETFQCPGVLCHILKLVNGRLKVLPQTDFCMKGLQKMIRRKRLARGMMLFILDTCYPRCEYPEQCLVLKWRWQCRNSPFQWLGSCKGLPPGEEVVFSNVLHIAWPNAVQVGTAPRALLFPSAESCLEG